MNKHNISKLPIILLFIALICIVGFNIVLSLEYCDSMTNKTILEVSFTTVVYLLLWMSLYYKKRDLIQHKYSGRLLLLINSILYITPFLFVYTQIMKFI